jgi:hypothetical protein
LELISPEVASAASLSLLSAFLCFSQLSHRSWWILPASADSRPNLVEQIYTAASDSLIIFINLT